VSRRKLREKHVRSIRISISGNGKDKKISIEHKGCHRLCDLRQLLFIQRHLPANKILLIFKKNAVFRGKKLEIRGQLRYINSMKMYNPWTFYNGETT